MARVLSLFRQTVRSIGSLFRASSGAPQAALVSEPARKRWQEAERAMDAHMESGRGDWWSALPKGLFWGSAAVFALSAGCGWMLGDNGLEVFLLACVFAPLGVVMQAYAWLGAKETRARRLSAAMTGAYDSFYEPLFKIGETEFFAQHASLSRAVERARHAMEIEAAANEGAARALAGSPAGDRAHDSKDALGEVAKKPQGARRI